MLRTMERVILSLKMPSRFQKPAGTLSYKLLNDQYVSVVFRKQQDAYTSRYGLLASVLADRKDDFDRFLKYYNEQENEQGLACWQQASCAV